MTTQLQYSPDQIAQAMAVLQSLAGGGKRESLTLEQLFSYYAAAKQEKHRDSGWTAIQGRLRALVRVWGADRDVMSLSHDTFDEYIATRMGEGVKRCTAVLELQSLVTAINTAVRRRKLPSNPVSGYEFDRQHGNRERAYTEAEIDALLSAAKRCKAWEVHAVIAVMRNTGIRPRELFCSRRESLNWETGLLRIPGELAKTGVARVCAVWPEGLKALRMLRTDPVWLFPSPKFKGRHVRQTMVNDQWHRVVDVSLIAWNKDGSRPDLYSLRGTLATRLALEEGYEISQLMVAMGWVNPGQARAYVRSGERQVLEAAARLQAKGRV